MSGQENLPLTTTRRPMLFYGYIVVMAAFLIQMATMGVGLTFGVFFKPLITEFGWTRGMTMAVRLFSSIVSGLLFIVAGGLNDRFGPRVIISVGGFFLGLGYVLMSQISTIWHFYLLSGVVITIGGSGSFVPLSSTVARWFVKRRGLMTGIVVSGIGLGTMIMSPVASRLILSYGWRTTYMILGSVVFVLIVSAAQFLRRDPSQKGLLPYGEEEVKVETSSLQVRGFSLREAVHIPQFWMIGAIYLCSNLPLMSIIFHIVAHATDLGISAITAANILAIIGGVSVAGRVIMGTAADRIGSKPALIISFILMAVALFYLLVAKDVGPLYLFAVIFGFGYGGMVVAQSPVVAELFGLRSHGAILGTVAFSAIIGGSTGSFLTGLIFDITNSYHLAFVVCAAFSVISLILTLLLRPGAEKGE